MERMNKCMRGSGVSGMRSLERSICVGAFQTDVIGQLENA